MTYHRLKCWPEFFDAVLSGKKKHELRRCDDRTFVVGDTLHLDEYNPQPKQYTGRTVDVLVTYITSAESVCAFSPTALDKNYVILSIALASSEAARMASANNNTYPIEWGGRHAAA